MSVTASQNKVEDIEELFKQNNYTQIVDIVEKNLATELFVEKLAMFDLSLTTSSLFLEVTFPFLCKNVTLNSNSFKFIKKKQNSQRSLSVMKKLLDICNQQQLRISDSSKLHFFLLACFQNEPNFAIGSAVSTGMDEMSVTLFKNLKVK